MYGYTTTKTCKELGEGGVRMDFPIKRRGGLLEHGSRDTSRRLSGVPGEDGGVTVPKSINCCRNKRNKRLRSAGPTWPPLLFRPASPPPLTATPRGRLLNGTRGSVSFADRKPLFIFSCFSNARLSLLVAPPPTSLPLVTSAARIYDFLHKVAVRGKKGRKEGRRERGPPTTSTKHIDKADSERREGGGREGGERGGGQTGKSGGGSALARNVKQLS